MNQLQILLLGVRVLSGKGEL
ncbi:hypothetical protein TrispH2_011169 [Trichoplax sp. H2]|nr:hypothetical protein TrispH2_011169 [Trichoplax sp. H2]|eukprot:RDD37132.1 hypothetical protein TrispH2_011169 [Trichoplax sp. H2]